MGRIGKLDQEITLQSFTLVDDGAGGKDKVWADLDDTPDVWAQVFPGNGRELLEEGRDNARAIYVFRIHRRGDLDERMRIIWQGVPYDIRVILRESERERFMRIQAERGV